ncbi:MAG: acyl-CoA thioesterase [Saprospiraceae bacterium]|nr:acyl-CoA thioesterase [Saprospiraceae bacterium]
MKRKGKKISESATIMSEMVMPNDTNPLHNLMGGNLMRWMDIAAGICAGRHCESYVVTASVDHVSFQRPIPLGDVITINARVTRAFSTSVEVYVEVFADSIKGGDARRCNDAYFTFVGVDEKLQPCPVPPVIPLTKDEQEMHDGALRRRELRLILSGRMNPKDAGEIRTLFA